MGNEIDRIGMGKRIRGARESLNMSREALAEKVPMSASFLADIEGGTKKLGIDKFNKIVQVLDVSADYVLFGKSKMDEAEGERKLIYEKISRDLDACDLTTLAHIESAVRSFAVLSNRDNK